MSQEGSLVRTAEGEGVKVKRGIGGLGERGYHRPTKRRNCDLGGLSARKQSRLELAVEVLRQACTIWEGRQPLEALSF